MRMPAVAPSLQDLRAEIDRLDQQLVELVIERTQVVKTIAEVKGDRSAGRIAMRPAREAAIMRALIEQADGRFPPAVLVRMWRELICALTRMQSPLAVAVCAGTSDLWIWDLARDHFGALTPVSRVDSASQAMRAVGDTTNTVAVLPMPGDDDTWWLSLVSNRPDRLRVFARLPWLQADRPDNEQPRALAVGRIEVEPSGDDLSLLAVEAERDVSRGRVRDLLACHGLDPSWIAVHRLPKEPQAVHLVEVTTLVLEGDPRLGAVLGAARGEILRIATIGGYPRPMRSDPTA